MIDAITVKEKLKVANRKLQVENMIRQGNVGWDGRYGEWRNIRHTGIKLGLIGAAMGILMAVSLVSLLMLGGML